LPAYFLRRVRNPAEGEDWAHDVFLRLTGISLEQLPPADAYIFQIAATETAQVACAPLGAEECRPILTLFDKAPLTPSAGLTGWDRALNGAEVRPAAQSDRFGHGPGNHPLNCVYQGRHSTVTFKPTESNP
jgi:hypothetical protein